MKVEVGEATEVAEANEVNEAWKSLLYLAVSLEISDSN